ncbi:MAG: P-II family nitrogen regulator [Nitrososphaerales archaeon]
MKRVEAIIATEKVSAVNDALKRAGVGGVTVLDGKGRGAGHREEVHGSRGTARFVPEFHSRTSIVTVVDDSKVDAVINAITSAASSGSPGDGKIFISAVDDAVDIGSKKRGKDAI